MVAVLEPRDAAAVCPEPLLSHWRMAGRMNTIEEAERMVSTLESDGEHAVISMLDGLCVLVEQDSHDC